MAARTKSNRLFWLAAVFVLLVPASVANGLSFAEPAKYARLLTTILIVGFAVFAKRGLRFGLATNTFLAFLCIFLGAGLWSDNPLYAVFYKWQFGLAVLSGILIMNSVSSGEELRRGIRFLGLVSAMAATVALFVYLRDPKESTSLGRMNMAGLNANMLGQVAASMFILCLYVALNRPTRFYVLSMGLACAMLITIILGTGSRGSLLMALSGMSLLMLPVVKRPGQFAAISLGFLLVAFIAFEVLDLEGASRLLREASKDTRGELWAYVLKLFGRSPIIGIGWFHFGNRQGNTHSAYLQVLVESGVIGAVALVVAVAVWVITWVQNHLELGRRKLPRDLSYLTAALLLPPLLHGIAESATFIAVGLNAMMMGIGVVLLDRTLQMSAAAVAPQRQVRRAQPVRYGILGWGANGSPARGLLAPPAATPTPQRPQS